MMRLQEIYKRFGPKTPEEHREVEELKKTIVDARRMLKENRIQRFRKKRPDYSENIIQEFDAHNLSLWHQRSEKDIYDLLDTFNLESYHKIDDQLTTPLGVHERKTVFLELCFVYRLSPEKVKKYF